MLKRSGGRQIVRQVKTAIAELVHDPVAILSNPFTGTAGIIGAIGGLVADQLGAGYGVVLAVVLLFIGLGIWSEARKSSIYKHAAIPLPIVINVSNPANSDNALNALFNLIEQDRRFRNYRRNLAQYLQISPSDLIFNYRGDIYETERLKDFLKITRYDLEKLKTKTPRNTVINLAYIGPASVGILIGTVFSLDSARIFQYSKTSDSYYPVVEIRDRTLKEDVAAFEKFEVKFPPKRQPNVTVAIDVSSHKISSGDSSIEAYGDLIYMKSQSIGTIELHEDWMQYSREIFKVLNLAQQSYEEIRLVYSMPVALAIILGIALQNYWNIMLTQYDSSNHTYRDLMKLNALQFHL
ncbi:SAVED domain-containing protein [Pantanalinema rosaneae CENA516]|uniref:SAVED domain-containing protein n=1 Tax=Pantanalinema rosaneae TaxID=1620701 RepID=UPI003D6ED5DB